MKKILIHTITAATLALFTVIPETALANTLKEDVNHDGIVSYEDYNLVVRSNGWNGSYDMNGDFKVDDNDLKIIKEAIVPTKIKGDLNDDGVVSLEDSNLFSDIFPSTPIKFVTIDDVLNIVLDVDQIKLGYDPYNEDLNNDGYFNAADEVEFDKLYPLNPTNIKGDVNNDGNVDRKDLALFERYIATPWFSFNNENADLNNDGNSDNTDYKLLEALLITN